MRISDWSSDVCSSDLTSMRLIGHLSLDSRDADHAEKFYFEVAVEGLTEYANSAVEEAVIKRALRSKHAQGVRCDHQIEFAKEFGPPALRSQLFAGKAVFHVVASHPARVRIAVRG